MNPLDSLGRHTLATAEFVIVAGAAVAFAGGAARWGGALLIIAGGIHLLRHRAVRRAGKVTSLGALYDDVLGRAGEAVLCGGIALYFLRGGIAPERITLAVMIAFTALVLVWLAAYVRARAEGLGVEARSGIPPVAARAGLFGVAPLVLGTQGLVWMTLAFAVASAVTVVSRVIQVARSTAAGAGQATRKRDTLPSTRHMSRGDPLR